MHIYNQGAELNAGLSSPFICPQLGRGFASATHKSSQSSPKAKYRQSSQVWTGLSPR